jgi:hypothetical protein
MLLSLHFEAAKQFDADSHLVQDVGRLGLASSVSVLLLFALFSGMTENISTTRKKMPHSKPYR